MGHHNGRQTAVTGGEHQAHHALGVGRVERPGGLVGQQEPATPDDGPGDGDPLALATGELVGVVRGPVRQPEVLEGLEGRRLGLAGRDSVQLQRQGHVLHPLSPASRL